MRNISVLATIYWHIVARCLIGFSLVLILARTQASDLPAGTIKPYQPQPDEFVALGNQVLELLQSGDAKQFASNLTATAADWQSILATNLPTQGEDPAKGFQSTSDREFQTVESRARAVLDKAAAFHLDFTKGNWRARVIRPKNFGTTHYSNIQAANETLPWTEKLEIILESGATGADTANGEFKLVVRGLIKFPAGWRSYEGIIWEAFPNNVGDEKTRRELALETKIAVNQGINGHDDPALLDLGETLVRFIRERDPAIFERDAYVNADLIWRLLQKSGKPGPTRKEFEEELKLRGQEQADFARATIKQMTDAGIDLKNADIKITEASVEHTQAHGNPGALEGMMGERFQLKLAVKSAGKSRNGTQLSGQYILAANQLMRFEHDWKVMDNIHWNQLPEGLLDPEVVAKMTLENYVAAHRALPPGTVAPEIEFVSLAGEKRSKLSDLKGKVVVLDYWATWCGPCQEPMADLQKLRAAHPDWKDRVAIVPLSIDDTLDIVREHVEKRGWTNTFNVWADHGGWRSKPAVAFRVTGVPTTYIIDATGKIVIAGHPAGMRIGETVDALLKK